MEEMEDFSDLSDSERQRKHFEDVQNFSTLTTEDEDEEPRHDHREPDSDEPTSTSSTIPTEKKEELNRLEQTPQGMIQEATMDRSTDDSEDFEDAIVSVASTVPRRLRKSPSAQSTTDSVVSVIEYSRGKADALPTPALTVTGDDGGTAMAPSPKMANKEGESFFSDDLPPTAPARRRSRDSSPSGISGMTPETLASQIKAQKLEQEQYLHEY